MQGMPGDSMKMDALQTQILDIMRQSAPPYEQEQNKGESSAVILSYPYYVLTSYSLITYRHCLRSVCVCVCD